MERKKNSERKPHNTQTEEGSSKGATVNSVAPQVVEFNETGFDPQNREVLAKTFGNKIEVSKGSQSKTFKIKEIEKAKEYFIFLVSCSHNQ